MDKIFADFQTLSLEIKNYYKENKSDIENLAKEFNQKNEDILQKNKEILESHNEILQILTGKKPKEIP